MLKTYRIEKGDLVELPAEPDAAALRKAQWIDLCDATPEEKSLVESTLKVDVDPVNDYEPFQVSTHFAATATQLTMTGLLLNLLDGEDPHLLKVTFIRSGKVLITVTNDGPHSMSALTRECENSLSHRSGKDEILAIIFDMIVDHTDNILDKVGHDLDEITAEVFQHRAMAKRMSVLQRSPRVRNRQLERVLTDLGPSREILVKLRRSVLSFRRMNDFLREQETAQSLLDKVEIFERDLVSIAEAESDLSNTAGFLLDGIVGYIGLLQNKVMNVLTLVGVVLTPPMVIAGIYGMNFKNMPELNWTYGYPFSLALMVVTTGALYLYVRWRGL